MKMQLLRFAPVFTFALCMTALVSCGSKSGSGNSDTDELIDDFEERCRPRDDEDLDGVCDEDDACPGFIDSLDSDEDGIPDGCDECPDDPDDDSDGDGSCDSDDICAEGDDTVDRDGDGQPDACDPCPDDDPDDSDDDGVCDSVDQCPNGSDVEDRDGDGEPDGCDACPWDAPDDSDGDGSCDSDDLCPGADDRIDEDEDGIPHGCDFSSAPATIGMVRYSGDVALLDVDGDDDTDMVTATGILENDGTGRFTFEEFDFVIQFVNRVETADLNGDAHPDVLLLNDSETQIWFGDGAGGFDEGPLLDTPHQARVLVGDLDDQNGADLIFYNGYFDPTELWFNDGSGQFEKSAQELDDDRQYYATLLDVDLDGDLDFFSTDNGNNLLRLNDGAGDFSTSVIVPDTHAREGVAAGDLDGDDYPDVVVAGSSGTYDQILYNDGAGGFEAPVQLDDLGSNAVVLLDADGDGDLDIVLPHAVYSNEGSRTFTETVQTELAQSNDASHPLIAFLAGELDGDEAPELVVVRFAASYRVFDRSEAGEYEDIRHYFDQPVRDQIVTGDVDGDGHLDAIALSEGTVATVWLGDGSGNFTPHGQVLSPRSLSGRGALFQLNDDDALDFIEVGSGDNHIWFGDGTGQFLDGGPALGGGDSLAVVGGFFDADDALDLAVANEDVAGTTWLNDGLGVFTETSATVGGLFEDLWDTCSAVGDFNGDGNDDVALLSFHQNDVLLGDGQGAFVAQTIDSLNAEGACDVGDLDGDGYDDLFQRGAIRWGGEENLLAEGDFIGAFDFVELADIDGDGDLDAFTIDRFGPLRIFMNDGAGVMTPVEIAGDTNGGSLSLGDFDEDGDLDALVSRYEEPALIWWNE